MKAMRQSISGVLGSLVVMLMTAAAVAEPAPPAPSPSADRGADALDAVLKRAEELLRDQQERLLDAVRRFVDEETQRASAKQPPQDEEQRKREAERRAQAVRVAERLKRFRERIAELKSLADRSVVEVEKVLGDPPRKDPFKPAGGTRAGKAADPERDPLREAAREFSQAMRLYETGEYEKSIERFTATARALDKQDTRPARAYRAVAIYRRACAYAVIGRIDPAFQSLEEVVRGGFRDLDELETDAELDALREDPRFDRLYRFARSLKG
jgi:Skp family chaperone for outer membrane proteins